MKLFVTCRTRVMTILSICLWFAISPIEPMIHRQCILDRSYTYPPTHLAHSSDPSEVGKGQNNSVFGSISRSDVWDAPLTQISAQTKQHGADRGAMYDSLDESNVRPMVGLIHIASTKSRNSIRYRISRYNESIH